VVFASQCGGFAYFPDPNVAYYSVPQFLVFLVSPMRAVQLTFLLFSLIGLAGCYGLMRHAFRSSRSAAVLAAGIFVFNGFFAYRMLIGHLTFHAFALIPVMAVAVLPPVPDRRPPLLELVGRACVAAACLAYMFQSGMVHGIPPALLAMAVILIIHGLCFGWRWQPWLLLAVAGAFSLALCAGKLVAELALLSNFPRDSYPLPGVAGLFSTLWVAAQTLFFFSSRRRDQRCDQLAVGARTARMGIRRLRGTAHPGRRCSRRGGGQCRPSAQACALEGGSRIGGRNDRGPAVDPDCAQLVSTGLEPIPQGGPIFRQQQQSPAVF
jgi:hypothetical protein